MAAGALEHTEHARHCTSSREHPQSPTLTHFTPLHTHTCTHTRSITFRLHAVRDNNAQRYDKQPNSARGCADPFAWPSSDTRGYALVCTGGLLPLFHSPSMSTDALFEPMGEALGGRIPGGGE